MIAAFIQRAVIQGIPLLFGSTGEIITEKSGHLNLGIPGIMYVGAISGVTGSFLYENTLKGGDGNPLLLLLIPLLSCIIGSLLMGLIYCFLTVTLRANQNVTGLALTTFGIGIGNFFGASLIRMVESDTTSISLRRTSDVISTTLPFADKCGWFGTVFLSYGFLAYLAIIVAILSSYILTRTRIGLNLRAVGENPATADAMGINVTRYKYVSTCIGSIIAGLGGLYYVMDYADGVWSNDAFGDRGWLAIALVIFVFWKPVLAIPGSILFGGLYILTTNIRGLGDARELVKMLPYIVTLVVLIVVSMRKKRELQPPESLGVNYFREER